jgi:hypothetical protein
MANRIAEEFEDELISGYRIGEGEVVRKGGKALYQKILVLENSTRYKLDLVLKDLVSGKVGAERKAIIPPKFRSEELSISSLILSDHVFLLDDFPDENSMFVLGDVKIRPSLNNVFSSDRPLAIYLQAYHMSLNQTDLQPSMRSTYRISREGDTVLELVDEAGQALQFFSSRRIVLIQELPVVGLKEGRYRLEVVLEDKLSEQSVSADLEFEMREAGQEIGG